ncbi:prolactin regulatory element-binding protein-like [Ruditapes philippinarum]|uniref:prolactin regulatory element-binding protein-like n=1 Tax=Ruditapes philippinarum TaxID=129788 RepID=UPI00295BC78F|nr:prolactin regulatory element-binding protein-like [Ruditapes philippinarum]
MAPEKGKLIVKSDFPMYIVKSLGERHFLVAGGGGQAKTGVSNAIEIYEIKQREDGIHASSVCRHDLGLQAPMNGATLYDGRHHMFAGGLDDECHLFSLKYRVISPQKSEAKDGKSGSTEAVKRKGKESKDKDEPSSNTNNHSNETKHVTFEVEKIKSVRTDFCSDGSFQKCVQIGPDHSIIATGGADGHLRVWKTDGMTKLHDIAAHKSEIDDLDISPKGDKIVTIARGNFFCVWNTKDGKKHLDMEWPGKAGEHRFRACRFGLKEGNLKKGFNLYTINIPIKRQTKPDPCFIALWDGESFKPRLVMNAGTEVLSSLAVSDDGVYVGVGMITGSVAVYTSFNLQKLYYIKEAHSIFVTGLDFMPVSEGARAVSGNQDFTLLSISADNTVRVHQEPTRGSVNAIFVLLAVAMILIGIFYSMAWIGL